MTRVAAVDLGASSGRVLVGTYSDHQVLLEETARFSHLPAELPVGKHGSQSDLVWDLPRLWNGIKNGLYQASRLGPLAAIGIDTWALDYGVLDSQDRLVGLPDAYRSSRTVGVPETLEQRFGDTLAKENGLQVQNFNTIYQLAAHLSQGRSLTDTSVLLLADLLSFWLSGSKQMEVTNASTTGFIDPRTREFSPRICQFFFSEYGVDPRKLFGPLREPGTILGPCQLPLVDTQPVPTPPQIIAVGSHDTASAVAGIPATAGPDFAYLSVGTWSLLGMELSAPIMSSAARKANFTNELGVGNTVRFLKNLMGTWVVSQCLQEWERAGIKLPPWSELDQLTAQEPLLNWIVDLNSPLFFAPGAMTNRIDQACMSAQQSPPRSPVQYLRCIYDSLALGYRDTLQELSDLTNRSIARIHLVGGGSKNAILAQNTADATGLPVIAGPVEATALGNIGLQLYTLGALNDLVAQDGATKSPSGLGLVRGRASTSNLEASTGHPKADRSLLHEFPTAIQASLQISQPDRDKSTHALEHFLPKSEGSFAPPSSALSAIRQLVANSISTVTYWPRRKYQQKWQQAQLPMVSK